MTRHETPATRTPTLRRWLATAAVLVVAVAAGLGNAPGPTLSLVRHESIGKYPPTLNPTRFHMAVTLPQNRTWVALYYFRYGQTTPMLQVRARSVSRPLPRAITLSYGLPGVKTGDFDVVKAKGEAGKGLISGSQKGWYAVLIEEQSGQRSMVTFEAGQKVSRGYFSCSNKPRLERHETHRKLAPPEVRGHFQGLFNAVPRHVLTPSATPPAKKRTPTPQPPPKQPTGAPPAGK